MPRKVQNNTEVNVFWVVFFFKCFCSLSSVSDILLSAIFYYHTQGKKTQSLCKKCPIWIASYWISNSCILDPLILNSICWSWPWDYLILAWFSHPDEWIYLPKEVKALRWILAIDQNLQTPPTLLCYAQTWFWYCQQIRNVIFRGF